MPTSVKPEDISLRSLTSLPPGSHVNRGGYKVYPGRGEHPFRVEGSSDVPIIKEEEVEKVFQARVGVFNLENEDDKVKYQTIVSDCANGKAVLGSEQVILNKQKGYWEAFIKWYEIFEQQKPKRR